MNSHPWSIGPSAGGILRPPRPAPFEPPGVPLVLETRGRWCCVRGNPVWTRAITFGGHPAVVTVAPLPESIWGVWLDVRAEVQPLNYAGQACAFASVDQARDYIDSHVGPMMDLVLPRGFSWGGRA